MQSLKQGKPLSRLLIIRITAIEFLTMVKKLSYQFEKGNNVLVNQKLYKLIDYLLPEYLYGRCKSSSSTARPDLSLTPKIPILLQTGDHKHGLDNEAFPF